MARIKAGDSVAGAGDTGGGRQGRQVGLGAQRERQGAGGRAGRARVARWAERERRERDRVGGAGKALG